MTTFRIKRKQPVIRLRGNFDPIKHPRDPETGKFVERPYPVPDDIGGLSTEQIVGELAASNDDFASQVEGLAVDVPGDDEGSAVPTEIQQLVENPDAGSGGSVEDIEPIENFEDIESGDTIRVGGELFRVDEASVDEIALGIEEQRVSGEYVNREFDPQGSFTFEEGVASTAGVVREGKTTFGNGGEGKANIRKVVETQYGPKLKINSPFEAKDAIKSLDFDKTHRSWNSRTETWDIDVSALDAAIQKLTKENFTVSVSNDILELADVEQPSN